MDEPNLHDPKHDRPAFNRPNFNKRLREPALRGRLQPNPEFIRESRLNGRLLLQLHYANNLLIQLCPTPRRTPPNNNVIHLLGLSNKEHRLDRLVPVLTRLLLILHSNNRLDVFDFLNSNADRFLLRNVLLFLPVLH
jgi:hypothetical protein